MSTIGMEQPGCRLRDRFVAAVFVLAVPSIALAVGDGICLRVLNEAAPPGGSIQLEVNVDVNDPTPIIIDLQPIGLGADLGAVQGLTLPGAPDAAGTAVIDGNSMVIRTVSPSATLGLSSVSMIAVTIAVPDQAPLRTTACVTPDPAASSSLDPFGYPCVAVSLGKSARPLLAATEAIFPVQTLSSAVFAAPTSGTFFGLALQNPEPSDSIVSVELWDAGSVVASASLALPPRTKVSREVSELFPGVIPSAGSFLQVTATVPVQMLGLSGNEVDGSVTPVLPALARALDVSPPPAR